MKLQEYPHSCKCCKFTVYIDVSRQAFCKFSGIKDSDNICGRYVFDPFKYKVKRIRTYNRDNYKQEDFEIE